MYKKIVSMTMVIFLLAIGVVTVMVLAQPASVFAANLEIVGDKLGIKILPDNPLFSMENIAPGDIQNSTVTVKNTGDTAFSSSVTSKKESGDEVLFKNLDITIESNDGTHEYYSGSLKDLKNIELVPVLPDEEQKLNFRVYFPSDIGNELQGKALSIKFIFTAQRGQTSPSPSPSNTPGPSATPNPTPSTTPSTSPSATPGPVTTPNPTPDGDNNTVDIGDDDIPAAPVNTPEPSATPVPAATPGSGQNQNEDMETIEDEKIPQAMPKTGGIPAEVFYIAGLAIVIVGLKIRRN